MRRIVSIVLRGDIGSLVGSMRAATTSVRGAANQMTGASREAAAFRQNLSTVGDTAGRMGIGLVAAAGLAVKAAMDWQTAWAGVTKTIDGTPAQLAKIEQGLQDMSKVKPTSAIELAQIAESAGALGVKTKDILSFTSVMADLGQATNLTSDEAATSIAQLMNVMQTSPADVDNLGAALVDLGNKGASTERQIVQMAQNIAGAGSIVGLSEANVLALGNALASSGIEAEAGGSAISNVLIDIDKSVSTGSDKLAKFAQVAGMSADDFASNWEADPADALASFVEGLGKMNESGEDVFSTLTDLGQSDIRVTRALLNMAASGDMLRESLANGDAAWEASSALAVETAKRYDTTASQVKMSWNEITSAAVDAGNGLLPAVASIASALGNVGGAFSKLPAEAQGGATALSLVGGAGLLAVAGVSKMTTSIAANRAAMEALATSSPRAAAALGKMSKAVGIATIALGTYYALNKSQGGGDTVAGTEAFTKQFLAIADGSKDAKKALNDLATIKGDQDILSRVLGMGGGKSAADIDNLKELFNSASRNTLQGIGNKITPYDDAYDTATKGITQIDAALTQMVKSGAVDQAAEGFKYLKEETGKSVGDLKKQLPGYAEAVTAVANQQDMAAASGDKLADATGGIAKPMTEAQEATQKAQEALDAARESALSTSLSFFDFSRDAKQSFGDYLDQLEKSADAYANFTENALMASDNGLDGGLIDQLKEQGPEGALALADFADASEKEIARANNAFRDSTGLSQLQGELDLLPDDIVTNFETKGAPGAIQTAAKVASQYKMSPELVETILKAKDYSSKDIKAVLALMRTLDKATANPRIDLKTGGAAGQIAGIAIGLANLNGTVARTKTVHTTEEKKAAGGHVGVLHRAPGGSVIGAGTGTSDDIPAMLSNGEHVLTAEEVKRAGGQSAVYRLRAAIMAGLLPKFASGGAVEPPSKLEIKQQQKTVRDIEASLSDREKFGKKPKKGKDNRPTRNVLRGLDRQIALLELAEAKQDLRDLKSGKESRLDAKEKARDLREKQQQAADDAAKDVADQFASAKTSATSKFGIGSGVSAGSVDRNLARLLVDSQTFLGLLGDLKAKGASPWLLAQLVEAGPTKSAIRLAREYNTNQAALDSINGRAAQIDSYGNSYSALVGNAAFMQAGAWNSGISSASQAAAGAQVAITVNPAASQSEATIAHQVAGQLMWRMN